MEPFHQIVPDADETTPTLTLSRKTGRIPKGSYGFAEFYCTDPGCDCRRVLLLVFNEKQRQKAVISFGFDQKGALAGPFLDGSSAQSPYASELLEFFVQSLNSAPEWLERLYRHYRQVREVLTGKPYRGKPFPKPGKLLYQATPAPDLEAEIAQSLEQLLQAEDAESYAGLRKQPRLGRSKPTQRRSPAERGAGSGADGMASLVMRYARLGITGPIENLLALQDDLLDYLLTREDAGEELAVLLPALCRQAPEGGEEVDAALRCLYDTLDLLQREIREHRPGAKPRMERVQNALAQRIFLENDDLELAAAVTSIVVQSGAEVLPVLRDANSEMLRSGASRSDLGDLPEEEVMTGITRCLEAMGLSSPFDGVQALLELFVMTEPDIQIALTGELLAADDAMLREIAALMLFNPEPEVRLGVSQIIAALDGGDLAPETLRRLIVCRNWFPEEIRRNIDKAISAARKARVDCAPLAKTPAMEVYASPMDGSGAQSFQIVVRQGRGYLSCALLLKQGHGISDAFVIEFDRKKEVDDFLDHLGSEGLFVRSTGEYLDQRICQALADGAAQGRVPNVWLVRIAELLGSDRWLPAPFDAAEELAHLRQTLEERSPTLLSKRNYLLALDQVEQWHSYELFFASWLDEHDSVLAELEAIPANGNIASARAAIRRILKGPLEERRGVWLELIVVNTLWLKSWKKSPFPWHRLFHVACAVADHSIPVDQIPLMRSIARLSCQAYRERAGRKGPKGGADR